MFSAPLPLFSTQEMNAEGRPAKPVVNESTGCKITMRSMIQLC